MADLRDEHGNPIQLTDQYGHPVQLTDEYGHPMHLTGVATTAGSTALFIPPALVFHQLVKIFHKQLAMVFRQLVKNCHTLLA